LLFNYYYHHYYFLSFNKFFIIKFLKWKTVSFSTTACWIYATQPACLEDSLS